MLCRFAKRLSTLPVHRFTRAFATAMVNDSTVQEVSDTDSIGMTVLRNVNRGKVLDSMGIDWIQHQDKSLLKYCEEKKMSADDVKNAIKAKDRSDFLLNHSWTTTEFHLYRTIQLIVGQHHPYLHNNLHKMDTLVQKVCAAYVAKNSKLAQLPAQFSLLRKQIQDHMKFEEEDFFPHTVMIEHYVNTWSCAYDVSSNELREGALMYFDNKPRIDSEHLAINDQLKSIRSLCNNFELPEFALNDPVYRTLIRVLAELDFDKRVHMLKESIGYVQRMHLFMQAHISVVDLQRIIEREINEPGWDFIIAKRHKSGH
eukprot:TRINITY_DN32_c1_g1_i1.p1 TRINITY_DN32_c1_g1~~TRINITY_DN32_c1_g1_i1.p1  ORF type:complete len:334 (-),score=36.93 TRINITY_DN32_c1_g1_i1:296-1234(-)